MATTESVGIALVADVFDADVIIFQDEGGIPAFETEDAYLMSDGITLQAPIRAYDAGGPVGVDSVGRPVDALAMEFAPEPGG